MTQDARGWRVALVPERLVNPPPNDQATLPDILDLLQASGYGVLQVPPPGEHRLLLAVIADQVAEYAHHGYAVVAIGIRGEPGQGLHWRRLAPLLQMRGVALPPRYVTRESAAPDKERQRLAALLASFDLAEEDRRRWRM